MSTTDRTITLTVKDGWTIVTTLGDAIIAHQDAGRDASAEHARALIVAVLTQMGEQEHADAWRTLREREPYP